jgi:hypothetical protein
MGTCMHMQQELPAQRVGCVQLCSVQLAVGWHPDQMPQPAEQQLQSGWDSRLNSLHILWVVLGSCPPCMTVVLLHCLLSPMQVLHRCWCEQQ